MRVLYGARGGAAWPDKIDNPLDLRPEQCDELFREALALVRSEDRDVTAQRKGIA